MRKALLVLSILLIGANPAIAQSEVLQLPAVQFEFEEMEVAWETKIKEFPNNPGLGEGRAIKVGLVYDPIVEGPSFGDDIYIRFDGVGVAGGISPCIIVFVPGQSLQILPDKSFRIFSTDPKLSGVRNLLTDAKGEVIEDLTGDMTFFDLRLTLVNGVWRLNIELEKRADTFKADWVFPGGSIGTAVVIGQSGGFASPRKVEMVHTLE